VATDSTGHWTFQATLPGTYTIGTTTRQYWYGTQPILFYRPESIHYGIASHGWPSSTLSGSSQPVTWPDLYGTGRQTTLRGYAFTYTGGDIAGIAIPGRIYRPWGSFGGCYYNALTCGATLIKVDSAPEMAITALQPSTAMSVQTAQPNGLWKVGPRERVVPGVQTIATEPHRDPAANRIANSDASGAVQSPVPIFSAATPIRWTEAQHDSLVASDAGDIVTDKMSLW
jgi:hypothetical protein